MSPKPPNSKVKDEFKVYRMLPSSERSRPQIDLSKQRLTSDDWGDMDIHFSEGVETIAKERLRFVVEHPDALSWDWYAVSWWGMISQRAKDLLWKYAKDHIRAFVVSLNCQPYFLLQARPEHSLDALDQERSKMRTEEPASTLVRRYAFKTSKLRDPLIFQIPEGGGIFCTQSIRTMVENANLKGFAFEDMSRDVLY